MPQSTSIILTFLYGPDLISPWTFTSGGRNNFKLKTFGCKSLETGFVYSRFLSDNWWIHLSSLISLRALQLRNYCERKYHWLCVHCGPLFIRSHRLKAAKMKMYSKKNLQETTSSSHGTGLKKLTLMLGQLYNQVLKSYILFQTYLGLFHTC